MKEAYSALSKVYEYLAVDCDYQKWSQYVFDKLKAYSVGNVGLDCACGSGYFTRALKRGGYKVYGVDKSPEMLVEAERLSRGEGLNIEYSEQDVSRLKMPFKSDFITVINDAINYIKPSDILKTFRAFRSALKPNGILMFDFSSEYKLKNIIGNNLFGEDDESLAYLWFNKLNDDSVNMDISLFTRCTDGRYEKSEEMHTQYIHTLGFIEGVLLDSGFELLEENAHLGEKITDTTERIEIIARKK